MSGVFDSMVAGMNGLLTSSNLDNSEQAEKSFRELIREMERAMPKPVANTAVHEPEVIEALALADTMEEMGCKEEPAIIRAVCKLVPPPMFTSPFRTAHGGMPLFFEHMPLVPHNPKAILTNVDT